MSFRGDLLSELWGRPQLEARSQASLTPLLPGLDLWEPALYLRGWIEPSRIRVDVLDTHTGERRNAELQLGPAAHAWIRTSLCATVEKTEVGWHFERHLTSWCNDLFCEMGKWALEVARTPTSQALFLSPLTRAVRSAHGPILDGLRALSREALRRCDPLARAIARRFDRSVRFPLYRRLLGDDNRRIAQAARSAPGAVIFAVSLAEFVSEEIRAIATTIWRDLDDGRPLDRTLDEAIERWLPLWGTGGAEGALGPLSALSPARLSALRQRKRLLIRRACPLVTAMSLDTPPPLALVPEDIPRAPRDNARWFMMMSDLDLVEQGEDPDPRFVELARFVSRTAAALDAALGAQCPMYELVAYARATGRFPTRSTSVRRLRRELDDWRALRARLARRLLPNGGGLPGWFISEEQAAEHRLPDAPLPGMSQEGISINPITTALELFEEGRAMHHCVAHCLDEIVGGRTAIYRAEIGGERVTVALRRHGSEWHLDEVKGVSNAEASPTAQQALRWWLDARVIN